MGPSQPVRAQSHLLWADTDFWSQLKWSQNHDNPSPLHIRPTIRLQTFALPAVRQFEDFDFAFPPFSPAFIASSGFRENERLSAGTDFPPSEDIERRFSKSIAAKPFGFFVIISSSGQLLNSGVSYAHDGLSARAKFSGDGRNAHSYRQIVAHTLLLFFAERRRATENLPF